MRRAGLKASGNIGTGFGVGQLREGSRGQQWDQCCRRACAAERERRCWTRAAVLHVCGTTDTCGIAGAWPHLAALPETSPRGSLQAASSSPEPGPRPWDDGRNPAPGRPAAGCREVAGQERAWSQRWDALGRCWCWGDPGCPQGGGSAGRGSQSPPRHRSRPAPTWRVARC